VASVNVRNIPFTVRGSIGVPCRVVNTPTGSGPALPFTHLLPDTDYHSARGGRALPLYRDAEAKRSNIAPGLLELLGTKLTQPPTAPDLLAYVAAVTAHPGYTERFAKELNSPGARIPLTSDAGLWQRAVDIGREGFWLHTYGERYIDAWSPHSLAALAGFCLLRAAWRPCSRRPGPAAWWLGVFSIASTGEGRFSGSGPVAGQPFIGSAGWSRCVGAVGVAAPVTTVALSDEISGRTRDTRRRDARGRRSGRRPRLPGELGMMLSRSVSDGGYDKPFGIDVAPLEWPCRPAWWLGDTEARL
jgi:hypothetical protein